MSRSLSYQGRGRHHNAGRDQPRRRSNSSNVGAYSPPEVIVARDLFKHVHGCGKKGVSCPTGVRAGVRQNDSLSIEKGLSRKTIQSYALDLARLAVRTIRLYAASPSAIFGITFPTMEAIICRRLLEPVRCQREKYCFKLHIPVCS